MVNPVPNRATRFRPSALAWFEEARTMLRRGIGAALDLVEYEVRGVGGDESEVGATVDKLLQGCGDVVRQVAEAGGVENGEDFVGVEAVNDYVRIDLIGGPGAAAGEDGAVVVAGGLRARGRRSCLRFAC
jgi:imidazole glycerol phosphate synthase subunit HisF